MRRPILVPTMVRRTLRVTPAQKQLLRTAAYIAGISQHAVIRYGLTEYEQRPGLGPIERHRYTTAILLLLTDDVNDQVKRLMILHNQTWSEVVREAITHGTRRLIRQHHPKEASNAA